MDRDRRHTHSVTLPGETLVTYTPQESAYLESNIGITSSNNNNNNNNSKNVPIPPPHPMFPVGYIQPQHLISLQGSHTSQSLPKYLQDGAMSMPEVQHHAMMQHGNYTTPRRVARTKQERSVEVGRVMPLAPGHTVGDGISGNG